MAMSAGEKKQAGMAGLAFASSAISSFASGSTARQNIKNTGEAARANIEYGKNEYLRRSNIAYEQERAIDRELGDMMSQRGLEAMKAEARLRAAGASTGLEGGDIDEVVAQAGYDQILDNQVMIARARSQRVDTYRSRLASYMDLEAKTNAATQATQNNLIETSSINLQALSAGIQTASMAIQLGALKGGNDKGGGKVESGVSEKLDTGSRSISRFGTYRGSQQTRMLNNQWRGDF